MSPAMKLPGLMLLITARKAFPSLQLGPKSFTCTPSCLLTCVKESVSQECSFQALFKSQPGLGPTEAEPSWLQPSSAPEFSCWCFPRAQNGRHPCWNDHHDSDDYDDNIGDDDVDIEEEDDDHVEDRPACIARRSWSSLTKLLKHSRVLLDLPTKLC